MLTPEYLRTLPENILLLYEKMEDDMIWDISRRLKDTLELSGSADYQLRLMAEMGYNLEDVKKRIAETNGIALEELDKMLDESAMLSYANDKELYKLGGKVLPPLQDNIATIRFIEAAKKQTLGIMDNLTGTFGFIDAKGFMVAEDFYHKILNMASIQYGSGAKSYDQAIRQAVKTLGDSGVRTISYSSGRALTIENVARMCSMTGVNQITGHMSEANADMMGQDLMEITAHGGARPDHAEWQGQVVSRSGRSGYLDLSDIGHGRVDGFMGANCRHNWFPYFEGVSRPSYSKFQLEHIDKPDVTYEGKVYTDYEASQKQRQIERSMRKTKRNMVAYEAAGLKNDFTSSSVQLRRQRDLYKDFTRRTGRVEQNVRHQTYNYNRSVSAKAVWAERKTRA